MQIEQEFGWTDRAGTAENFCCQRSETPTNPLIRNSASASSPIPIDTTVAGLDQSAGGARVTPNAH